jgi:hypothetical protein
MIRFYLPILLLSLQSCANLYKESSYVTDVHEKKDLKGMCGDKKTQNQFSLQTRKGEVTVSMPVFYSYWWTGPIVLPLIPITPERNDPSFIKVSVSAPEDRLENEELMKSEIRIKGVIEPIKPLTVIVTKKENIEEFIIQFDHPSLVDIKSFSLVLPGELTKEDLKFERASEVNYVPIVPVVTEKCVTE